MLLGKEIGGTRQGFRLSRKKKEEERSAALAKRLDILNTYNTASHPSLARGPNMAPRIPHPPDPTS